MSRTPCVPVSAHPNKLFVEPRFVAQLGCSVGKVDRLRASQAKSEISPSAKDRLKAILL